MALLWIVFAAKSALLSAAFADRAAMIAAITLVTVAPTVAIAVTQSVSLLIGSISHAQRGVEGAGGGLIAGGSLSNAGLELMAIVKTEDAERLMKRCQTGVGGRNALDTAHDIMAECYGTIGALVQERDRLLHGEFICQRCGLRKDSERSTEHEF